MRIESLQVENYKIYRKIDLENIPNMAVFIGKNGVGKTTFFDIFGFLHDCLSRNVRVALQNRGGFREVITREQTGSICFNIKFRPSEDEPLISYELKIGLDSTNKAVVEKEVLRFRRGRHGSPWKVLDFAYGEGIAAEGTLNKYSDVNLATRNKQKLDSPDILAIKGLGQFKEFEAVSAFRRLVEDWYVADFRIDAARERQEAGDSERLSSTGDNLSDVAKYLYENERDRFDRILESMKLRIPGVNKIEAQETADGYIVLKFKDGRFKDPFSAKFVSDGTIKMFTYLVLLNDPFKHALLCIEEPENQLYPELLEELAEEFREYSEKGGQVFISTHSPDFMNAIQLEEVFYLEKKDGYTTISRASDNELVKRLYKEGDQLGALWKQGILTGDNT